PPCRPLGVPGGGQAPGRPPGRGVELGRLGPRPEGGFTSRDRGGEPGWPPRRTGLRGRRGGLRRALPRAADRATRARRACQRGRLHARSDRRRGFRSPPGRPGRRLTTGARSEYDRNPGQENRAMTVPELLRRAGRFAWWRGYIRWVQPLANPL